MFAAKCDCPKSSDKTVPELQSSNTARSVTENGADLTESINQSKMIFSVA